MNRTGAKLLLVLLLSTAAEAADTQTSAASLVKDGYAVVGFSKGAWSNRGTMLLQKGTEVMVCNIHTEDSTFGGEQGTTLDCAPLAE